MGGGGGGGTTIYLIIIKLTACMAEHSFRCSNTSVNRNHYVSDTRP